MSEPLLQVEEHLRQHALERVTELQRFLQIPSVSADSRHKPDMLQAAEFVRDQLQAAGCTAEIIPTAGHPLVYGEWCHSPKAPTALVYGHYDVQPADPVADWISPPFGAEIRDGKIYARGATDDKGQLFTHVKSVASWLNSVGSLPVNVKFLIEGEEEVGSSNLETFLADNQARCRCDVAVISDTAQYGPGQPAITYGLRGIISCEVTVQGPKQDLHSGVFGGAIANPVNVLARLIASLHDDSGRIQIPGFYDSVRPLTTEERQAFAALPFDEHAFLSELGVNQAAGEAGFTTLERRWARPTCDVNGIFGGYQGEGPKTIIPAQATAKITCRLVADQNPEQVSQALEAWLRSQCPSTVRLTVQIGHGCPAMVCDLNSPYLQAARQAVEHAFGKAPVLIREGGSIPVVSTFKQILGVDTLLLGWGQNTDNLHSPNEHFSLEDFHRGTFASAALWQALGQLTPVN